MGDSSCSSPELDITNRKGYTNISPASGNKVVESARSVSAEIGDKLLNEPKCGSLRDRNDGDNVDMRGDDSTPGYTSDESGTHSPTPLSGRRHKLQHNIAFWEQWQHNGK
jgi:hypothetical protein